MVGDLLNISNGNTDSPTRPINNGALRCIQPGLGSSAEWSDPHRGTWSAAHHINYLELLAAFLAIKVFGKSWENTTVLLRMDNVTAVHTQTMIVLSHLATVLLETMDNDSLKPSSDCAARNWSMLPYTGQEKLKFVGELEIVPFSPHMPFKVSQDK